MWRLALGGSSEGGKNQSGLSESHTQVLGEMLLRGGSWVRGLV